MLPLLVSMAAIKQETSLRYMRLARDEQYVLKYILYIIIYFVLIYVLYI